MSAALEQEKALTRVQDEKAYEITSLNIRLNDRTFRLENLQKDVNRTRDKINKHAEDMMKVTMTLQKQIDEKTETIGKYTMKLQQMEREFAEEQNSMKDRFDNQTVDIGKRNHQEADNQERQMKKLLKTQEQLLEFKNAKLVKKKEIENEENRYKMLLSLDNQVQKQGAEDRERQKQKINAHYAQLLDDFRRNAIEKAEKNISEIERNIMIQNFRLGEEAKLQDEELAYMDNRNTQLELDNDQAYTDLKAKSMSMEEHAQRQFEKNKKIKLLKTKIDLLEKSLGQIVADFEKERELLKFQNEQIIREQHEELKNLHESIRQKNQEGSNLKSIVQMILDQRSDIEQFFLESMEQVKEEKRRQMETEMAAKQSHQQPEFLPLIEPGSKFSKKNYESQQTSTQSQQKITVELNDLDWADRETVLRLLFSKMNTGDTAGSWRDSMPESRQPTRSQGSRPTQGQEEQLNRGFREEDALTGDAQEQEQQQYDDEGYYDQEDYDQQEESHGAGDGE